MSKAKIKKALAGVRIASLIMTGGLGVSSATAAGGSGCGPSSCGTGKARIQGKKTGCGSSCGGKNMKEMNKSSCGGNAARGKTGCGGTACGANMTGKTKAPEKEMQKTSCGAGMMKKKTSCGGSG